MQDLRRVALIAVAAGLLGCAGTDVEATAPPASVATAASVPATATDVASQRPFAVERIELVVEDTSRPTPAAPNRGLAEESSRTLPLLVLVPQGDGAFPILEFSHGVHSTGPAYEPFLELLAAAGYVVVAPTFPLSSGNNGEIFDYVNQPGDVAFAIDAVLARAADPDDPLHGRVDPERIAIAGHSLGAMTTVGAAFNSCCADARIDAAISIAGVETPFPEGDYDDRPPTPLLLAHGGADPTIDVSGSEDLFAEATGPAAFLRFPEGRHSNILVEESGELLRNAMVAWLDRWLLDDPAGFDALPAAVEASGVATLATRDVEP